MAVKRTTKKPAAPAPVATIEIELRKAASYTHFGYGMTFVKGGRYTFNRDDAQELLGIQDEWGVPYFRKWAPPPPPKELLKEGEVEQGTLQTLPAQRGNDMSINDIDPDRAARKEAAREAAKVAKAPKPTNVVEPEAETPEAPGEVDSEEIDTGAGVEV
jgi:hypothetical protein